MSAASSSLTHRSGGSRGVLLGLASVALVACGPAGGKQPSWRTGRGGPNGAPGAPERIIVLEPDSPQAPRYNDPPRKPPPSGELIDRITKAVANAGGPSGTPVPDGRLYDAASDLAEIVPRDSNIAYALIQFALQRHGIIEPSPHLIIVWGTVDGRDELVAKLTEHLPDLLAKTPYARMGVGVSGREDDEEVVILALQKSFIDTEPVPRSLAKSGEARLSAKIHPPYREPEVFLTREDGSVQTLSLARDGGRGFRTTIGCGGKVGKNQVEVTAVDDSGSTVLANFPIWCGMEPPNSISVNTAADDAQVFASAEEAEARMRNLVNEDRARHGLPPLKHDPRLSAVARKHSLDMYENDFTAHVSPTTGSASDRIKAARIKTAVLLENVARAYGVAEAEEGLMGSPGHRANILAKEASHVGVGIVVGDESAGRRELFITQLFSRIPERIDLEVANREVTQKIKSFRSLTDDQVLRVVAHDFARELVSGVPMESASKRAAKRLDKVASHLSRVSSVVTTVATLEQFEPGDSLKAPTVSHFGVGIAQGDHETMGEDAITIVVLVGHQ